MPIYEVEVIVDGWKYREAVSAPSAQDAVDTVVKMYSLGKKRAIIEVEKVRLIKVAS